VSDDLCMYMGVGTLDRPVFISSSYTSRQNFPL
jgi:hypothetical protein